MNEYLPVVADGKVLLDMNTAAERYRGDGAT